MKLKQFEIRSFRGATQHLILDFDLSKKITMIFGENGNGKSTITDALVCLFTESNGSLDDRSSTKIQDLVSVNCDFREVLIKLTTDQAVYSTEFNEKGTAFKRLSDHDLPTVRQLRRSQITKLIDAEPAKRYDELRTYIDVSKIESSEESLRRLCKNTKLELDTQNRILDQARNTLDQAWNAEGKPMSNALEWGNNIYSKDLGVEVQKHRLFIDLIACWSKLVETLTEFETRKQEGLNATLQREISEKQVTEAQSNDSSILINLTKLLNEAKSYVEQSDPLETCPVCENSIRRNDLLKSLSLRIDSLRQYQMLLKSFESAQEKEKTALELKRKALESLSSTFAHWMQKIGLCREIIDENIAQLLKKIELEAAIEIRLKILVDSKLILEKSFKLFSVETEKIKTIIDQHNLLKKQVEAIQESENNIKYYSLLQKIANSALNLMEVARKSFITDELKSISEEVDRMYQTFHPNERLGGVKLFLKKHGKASLELNASFYDNIEITPQSIYSESHLDTLGICIFLGLARKYNSGKTILVLDDVVMSVDHEHLERFINLLHDESKHFTHIMLTTHYRPWRDLYRYNRAPDKEVHFIELRPWTIERGILIQDGRNSVEELQRALTDSYFDRQIIANRAGILLESVLDFLTLQYNCKLPRNKKGHYTLGEFLNGINSKLLAALRVEHFIDKDGKKLDTPQKTRELKGIIEELRKITFIRNQLGAHFNLSGAEVSDTDVAKFGKLSLELAELLICPETGTFPNKQKSGSYHQTRTGTIRLHPLEEPN